MKLTDINEYFRNLQEKVKNYEPMRKARCANEIKEVIRKYEKTKLIPDFQRTVIVKGQEITLSVVVLVEEYGMSVLDALFLIDTFMQNKEISEEQLNMLMGLRTGKENLKFDIDYLEAHVDPEVKKLAEK